MVSAGPGLVPRFLMGRRVACSRARPRDGTWAEFLVTRGLGVLPVSGDIELEQAAMLIVNPLSAYALLDLARRGRHRAVASTAAASALGRMILRLGLEYRLPVVHIVRRVEQVDLLKSLGAAHVLNSAAPDFDQELREICHRLEVTLAFDAIAGEMSGRLLNALPTGGRVVVYGGLSGAGVLADPRDLIFRQKGIEGFWLSSWLTSQNVLSLLRVIRFIRRYGSRFFTSEIQARVPLEEVNTGIALYKQDMTRGKVLITP